MTMHSRNSEATSSSGGSKRYRVARLATILVMSLVIGLRLVSETWSGAQTMERGRQESSRLSCNPLSIVCLADSSQPEAASPPVSEWTRLDPALKALRSTRQHIVLAGHSRLRHVFEQLQFLLAAPLRTRADLAPPLADQDDPLASSLSANSTCLGAMPTQKPTPHLWCSYAADWGSTLLDYRWRRLTKRLAALL